MLPCQLLNRCCLTPLESSLSHWPDHSRAGEPQVRAPWALGAHWPSSWLTTTPVPQRPPLCILPARKDSVFAWEDATSVNSVGTPWTSAGCLTDCRGRGPSLQACTPLELPWHGYLWELHFPQGAKKVIRYFEYYLWRKPCSLFHLC